MKPIPKAKPAAKQKPSFWQALGPGLITGASDDDPSGIGTYSQMGAQFGPAMLWTMLFSYPLMTVVQEISGRIGRVTGRGIAGNVRRFYPRWLLLAMVLLLFCANTINIGTDIGAMGAAFKLVLGGNAVLYAVLAGVFTLALQILIPYSLYVKILKWLTLALFAYVAVAFAIHVDWLLALRSTFLPHLALTGKSLTALLAVLGTTISPYLFFWQASQEVEDVDADPQAEALKEIPHRASEQLERIRMDTYTGMAFSNIVAWFIILAASATLHAHGITNISTADQAAEALKPVAGQFAFVLFALGIIGTGLLAVPVLAGSAAYAIGEALQWPIGLERKALHAKGFYAVIALSVLIGLAIAALKINPIQALYWTAVINGVAAGPILVVVMLLSANHKVMGKRFVNSPYLKIVGWLTTAVMLAAAVGMFLVPKG